MSSVCSLFLGGFSCSAASLFYAGMDSVTPTEIDYWVSEHFIATNFVLEQEICAAEIDIQSFLHIKI